MTLTPEEENAWLDLSSSYDLSDQDEDRIVEEEQGFPSQYVHRGPPDCLLRSWNRKTVWHEGPELTDFTRISDRLLVGGACHVPEDARVLKRAGVTHVLDCRGEDDDRRLMGRHGLKYHHVGTDDHGRGQPTTWFEEGLEFALSVLGTPGSCLYVHCAAGMNRGPSMAYAILRAWLGLSSDDAYELIRSVRPDAAVIYWPDADRALVELGIIEGSEL